MVVHLLLGAQEDGIFDREVQLRVRLYEQVDPQNLYPIFGKELKHQ